MLFFRSLAFISLPSMTAWTAHAAKVSLPRSVMCSTISYTVPCFNVFLSHRRIGRWFCLCRHGTPDKAFSRFPGIGRMVCSCEGAQLRGHTWNMYFLNEVEDNFYLLGIPMFAENRDDSQQSNDELLKLFLSAKQVEGCSERSLKYYRTALC